MHEELADLDLNLLRVLDAIAEHRQVTAAAASLGLSQSATSHALRRLREHVGDALLVRGRGGLVPTARGAALVASVRLALSTVSHTLRTGGDFEPATAERSFRIAAGDGFDIVVLPSLWATLRQQAPKLSLSVVRDVGPGLGARLQEGELDLYFGVLPNRPEFAGLLPDPGQDSLKTATVYTESWIGVVRGGHRSARRRPTLQTYAALDHVVVSPTGGGPGIVDRLLQAQGLSRRVTLRVSSFHTAMDAVERSDVVWTAPRTIAQTLAKGRRVRLIELPLELPDYPTQIVWHERFDGEPGHRWLRQRITAFRRPGNRAPRSIGYATAQRGAR